MRPRLAAAAALLCTLALACSGCAHASTYRGIRIQHTILLALSDIQSEFNRETAWCLLGGVDRNSLVYVDAIEPPMVTRRTSESAVFVGCDAARVVGWYHNHPRQPFDACGSSPADRMVTAAKRAYKLQLLSCYTSRGPAFIYRFRGDSLEYRIEPTEYLPAERLFEYLTAAVSAP